MIKIRDVLQIRLTIKKITKKQIQKRRICTKKQVQGITRKKICKSVQLGRATRTAGT